MGGGSLVGDLLVVWHDRLLSFLRVVPGCSPAAMLADEGAARTMDASRSRICARRLVGRILCYGGGLGE